MDFEVLKVRVFEARALLLGVALLALTLVVSAAILEHGFGVLPCKMCWWQRYAHWVIGGLALVGLATRRYRLAAGGIMLAALGGLAVALWQTAAQQGWLPFPASCVGDGAALAQGTEVLNAMLHTRVVPCDQETFTLLGLSLAAWNILAMLLCTGVALKVLLKSRQ